VADDDERAAPAVEFAFQPFDRGEIEMVGGSSSNRISGEGASTRASAARRPSPPERFAGSFVAVKTELLQHITGLVMVVAGSEARFDIGERRGVVCEIRLLRQITDGRAGLHKNGCRGRARRCRPRSQQRRFAGAVAANQAARSADDTDSSTPDNSGVPPKVSRMSFTGSAGGAMAFDSILICSGRGGPLALDAADGLIGADRNAERSRGAKDRGPPVTSPEERKSVIRLRTASVIPIDCSVKACRSARSPRRRP